MPLEWFLMKKEKKFHFDLSPRKHEDLYAKETLDAEIENYFGKESMKTSTLFVSTLS